MSKKIQSGERLLSAASVGLMLIGLAAMPLQAAAADPQVSAKPAAVESSDDITVVRDADTGQLRAATPEEHNALQQLRISKLRNARIAPTATLQKWHASGARGARLTDEFISAAVAVRKPDGTVGQECFDSHEAAEAAVHTAGHTATKLETE
ncbi:MAG TPA: hypothetical protein VFG03_11715 [Telluria sp.]|nr:hypothetical protein [Telluria sp.]